MRNYGLFLITGNARFMSSNSLNSYIPEPESRQPPGAREPTTLYPQSPKLSETPISLNAPRPQRFLLGFSLPHPLIPSPMTPTLQSGFVFGGEGSFPPPPPPPGPPRTVGFHCCFRFPAILACFLLALAESGNRRCVLQA